MSSKNVKNGTKQEDSSKYDLVPPDGGWGYMVALGTGLVFIATCLPLAAFGIIFGKFLASLGDPTSGAALANGFFNTTFSFTGLIANVLLNMYSFRKVGTFGTIVFFIGTLGVLFSKNLLMFIVSFGIFEGFGYGILLPVAFTAMNAYFDKKLTLMMSLSQVILIAGYMISPLLFDFFLQTLEYRGTLMILSGLSVMAFPSVFTFQPVKWHLKKVPQEEVPEDPAQVEPLMPSRLKLSVSQLSLSQSKNWNRPRRKSSLLVEYPREQIVKGGKNNKQNMSFVRSTLSIVSMGDRMAVPMKGEVEDKIEEENKSFWQNLKESMDLSLLKEPKYLSMSIGLALAYTADMSFNPIIPSILTSLNFSTEDAAFMTFVFFAGDLASRVLLTVVSAFVTFRSRPVVLATCFLSMVFRVVFVLKDTYYWKLVNLAILGFCRSYMQTLTPMVCSEEYPEKFSTAFTLYMAVNGVASLGCGLLMSVIKSATQSDVLVCHLLSVMYFIMVVTWIIELLVTRKSRKTETKNAAS